MCETAEAADAGGIGFGIRMQDHARFFERTRTDAVTLIGAVSGNEIIKINLLLHAFPVVTAKERNVISIAFRHRSVHDGHNCRGTTGQWS